MICAHTAIMPHISILRRDIDDRLSDLTCAHRSRRHRNIGGLLVNEIIQFIPRPDRDDAQTDFPTIAFRSARHEPVTDPVDAVPDRRAGAAKREA
jgi:hypothetical protein